MSDPIWRPFYIKQRTAPLPKVVKAEGCWLELEGGRRVLDMTCSWWTTLHGHCDPAIAEAIGKQAGTLDQALFANFTHDPAEELSSRLINILSPSLRKLFFSDNGSTSVEVALKMAVQATGNHRFIAFEGAYHGDTVGAMSVTDGGIFTAPFSSLLFPVDRIPYPTSPEQESSVLTLLEESITSEHAALIIEPLVQGAGGMRMCRPEFLQSLQALCRRHRLLTIYDEVFTGFGRTGSLFACLKAGTQPDILCLSKGITGGTLPLAITATTEELFDRFDTFFHGHSYTGNPIACAAANASLRLLEKAPYSSFEGWHRKYAPELPSFRVCGTIAAFELPGEGDYLNPVGLPIQRACFERGLFIRPLGPTLYLLPPFCTKEEELAEAYAILDGVLASAATPC